MAGRRAGRVTSVSGRLGLRYHDVYRAGDDPTPLSVSLPVQVADHGHDPVSAFLWGLLPDNDRVLRRWARTYQVSAANPASLLSSPVEVDCAGALQFVAADEVDEVLAAEGRVDWLTEAELAGRLRDLARAGTDWLGDRSRAGHFSLAGAQAKTALRHDPVRGRWGIAHGPEPTTHIPVVPTSGCMIRVTAQTYARCITQLSERWSLVQGDSVRSAVAGSSRRRGRRGGRPSP